MIRLKEITSELLSHHPTANIELVEKAYVYSAKFHQGQLRLSGEPYLVHPLEVAYILAKMEMDDVSIVAGLLHDTLENTDAQLDEIARLFGEETANIVEGVTKISMIHFSKHTQRRARNISKMIFAMSSDIRVILVKLADRLHNMRTLGFHQPAKQQLISSATLEIYAPLAGIMGIHWIQTSLEDLCLYYLEPEIYNKIKDLIMQTKGQSQGFIEETKDMISNKLEIFNIQAKIKEGYKHFYSIYRKMLEQNLTVVQVYDILAFRVIVNSIKECYESLGHIYSMWKPVQGRFKDYISAPKANMYQSLHITLIGPLGQRMEIQIRTWDMHVVAEDGVTSLWKYKEGTIPSQTDEKLLPWRRLLLQWQNKLNEPVELLKVLNIDLVPDEVYVFTPSGELRSFPKGASPIDFAYSIHSEVGEKCIGARVNGKMVPLSSQLETGGIVEIVTSPKQHPSKDWLNHAKTPYALKAIKKWLSENLGEALEESLEELESRLRILVRDQSYLEARVLLQKIVMLMEYGKAEELEREFGFLFDLEKEMEPDLEEIRKCTERINWHRQLWQILSEKNQFEFGKKGKQIESVRKIEKDEHFKSYEDLSKLKGGINLPSHVKGEKLEEAMMRLFRAFFTLGEENQKIVLNALRKQKGGTEQHGHDISFEFKFKDTVIDNPAVKCHVECKDYSSSISPDQVSHKLASEEVNHSGIHHWILISPYANPTNELKQLLDFWESEKKYPFDVQIWCPNTNVEELFGLNPIVYDEFYEADYDKSNPYKWSDEQRQKIYSKWLNKLRHPLRLPESWEDYLNNPSFLLFSNERNEDYHELYNNYVPRRCKGSAGNLINLPLEDYVTNWLNDERERTLFLLGEFGDGKSAFTYIIARKLAQDFLQDPNHNWLPVRFGLREFYKSKTTHGFVENRLKQFGATLKSWFTITSQFKVFVILDGFDEMSVKLDPQTIAENIRSLIECCEYFKGLKIMITSRSHFFRNLRDVERLRQRIDYPELIHLAPIGRRAVIENLEKAATTPDQQTALTKIQDLHDPIGLASKPLFLQMIKETLQGSLLRRAELTSDLSELTLYETYVSEALWRKKEFLDDDNLEALPEDIIENLIRLLEDVAWEYHFSGEKYVLLSKFSKTYGSLAEKLWTMSEVNVEWNKIEFRGDEDAAARIGVRSLLTPIQTEDLNDQWPVDFYHRSMREYFVAKKIYRSLNEDLDDAISRLSDLLLRNEVLDFLADMIRRDNIGKYEEFLTGFLQRNEAKISRSYIGANAATLIYRLTRKLPGNDWTDLILDQADLSGADLSRKNFHNSSLRNAYLDNVNFEYANFSYCDLTGVRIEETANIQALAPNPSEEKVLVAYDDGKIMEWDISHPRRDKSQIICTDVGKVDRLGFSPSEDIWAVIDDEIVFYKWLNPTTISPRSVFRIKSEYRWIMPKSKTIVVLSEMVDFEYELLQIDLLSQEVIKSNTVQPSSICEYLDNNIFIHSDKEKISLKDTNVLDKPRSLDIKANNATILAYHKAPK